MEVQQNEWSCSVYSFRWVAQSTGYTPFMTYNEALEYLSYPDGVNPTYGLTSSIFMVNGFQALGLFAKQKWTTFDEAYSICTQTTGTINPIGMYHFMAIRGTMNGEIYVANSAPGYRGIYSSLSRQEYNSLGPVQLIYLD